MYGEGKESEILKNKEADGGRGDEKAGEAGGLGSSSEAAGRRGELGRRWKKASRGEGREGGRPCLDAEFLMGEISTILCRDITSAKAGEGKAWGAT